MNQLPRLSVDNNSAVLDIGTLRLYFSYQTVIAFHDGDGLKVSENLWSTTTGKHLNAIDDGDKKNRLPRDTFENALKAALTAHGLS
jgi:hypothetical protein